MTDELKPCPFCGGEAMYEAVGVGWSVGCEDQNGECMGYQTLQQFARKCEAAGAWNTRAPVPDEAEIEHDLVSDETTAKLREQLAEKYGIGKGKLTPIEEPRAPVRVKKLVWTEEQQHTFSPSSFDAAVAETPFGLYFANHHGFWFENAPLTPAADKPEAEAAAQADFERRVQECLK